MPNVPEHLRQQVEVIDHNFTYRRLTPEQEAYYSQICDKLKEAAYLIVSTTKPTQAQSMAISALNECKAWIHEAMTR